MRWSIIAPQRHDAIVRRVERAVVQVERRADSSLLRTLPAIDVPQDDAADHMRAGHDVSG